MAARVFMGSDLLSLQSMIPKDAVMWVIFMTRSPGRAEVLPAVRTECAAGAYNQDQDGSLWSRMDIGTISITSIMY